MWKKEKRAARQDAKAPRKTPAQARGVSIQKGRKLGKSSELQGIAEKCTAGAIPKGTPKVFSHRSGFPHCD